MLLLKPLGVQQGVQGLCCLLLQVVLEVRATGEWALGAPAPGLRKTPVACGRGQSKGWKP